MEPPSSNAEPKDIVCTPATAWDSTTWSGLRDIVREDIATYRGGIIHPGQHVLLVHRFGVWAYDATRPRLLRRIWRAVFNVVNALYVRNILGFELSHRARIGRRVRFVHQGGVVIQPDAEIGDETMIFHGVTIGRRWEEYHSAQYHAPPKLGRGVQVGVGAVIVGAVQIGDGAKVGPNAVVTTDVPAGASVVAPPSRVLRLR